MSMITEQVKSLRRAADFRHTIGDYMTAGLHREAADTIEALSEKVRAANMERSTAYYNGGWIPVSERLPEKDDLYLICFDDGEYDLVYFCKGAFSYSGVIAWLPLPEPYREDGDTE